MSPAFNGVYREFFREPFPARTTLIAAPPNPKFLIEVEAVGGAAMIADGMRIDWDVADPDGRRRWCCAPTSIRPIDEGRYPVIITYGPYAKGLSFQDGYPEAVGPAWCAIIPRSRAGSSNKYQNWETVDPEKWVPDGYACVRVDSRGAGRSPGYIDHSVAARDAGLPRLHRVGGGAALVERQGRHARHLVLRDEPVARRRRCSRRTSPRSARGKATTDRYRDSTPSRRHPLRLRARLVHAPGPDACSTASASAAPKSRDHRRARSPGRRRSPTRSSRRTARPRAQRLLDAAARRRLLPRALGATGRRSRCRCSPRATGAATACTCAATSRATCAPRRTQKWLEMHGHAHWTHFYTDYGVALQKRFFGHFLKGEDNGWDRAAAGAAQLRHPGETLRRARTRTSGRSRARSGRSFYLDPTSARWRPTAAARGERGRYRGARRRPDLPHARRSKQETEITGPMAAKLFVSSSTTRRRPFPRSCASSIPTARRSLFQGAHRPAARRSRRAGCAPRTASSIRS